MSFIHCAELVFVRVLVDLVPSKIVVFVKIVIAQENVATAWELEAGC